MKTLTSDNSNSITSKLERGIYNTSTSVIKCLSTYNYSLWSSGQCPWLLIQRFHIQYPVLPDFLRSSESEMRFTQPCEKN
jgi:hypothetical protein